MKLTYEQGLIIGISLGSILVTIMWAFFVVRPLYIEEQVRTKMINDCESRLPRFQKCKLAAVSENTK